MPAEPPVGAHVTYTQQFRRCGKADCPLCSAGKRGHGPYWYAYWREDGRVRTRYLGRQAPAGAPIAQAMPTDAPGPPPQSAAAPDTLRVRTLGAFQVWRGPDPIPDERWSRRGAGALLKCLLAAPGYRLHREQAMEMLWPESDPEIAAGNLRLALHALRAALDAPGASHLQAVDHWLALAPGRATSAGWLDAEAFAQAAMQALAGRDVAACRAALTLYTGEYLPDDRYAEWAVGRREELRQLWLALLLHQANLYTEQGYARGALRALRSVLEADPCHEAAARAMMRLHAVGGRRSEAIRVYHRFAAALRRELDLEPEPETLALFHALQPSLPAVPAPLVEGVLAGAGRSTRVPAARSGFTNLPSLMTTFVGRQEATVELRRLLAQGRSGSRLVTLTGAGGCGKTRLAVQVASDLLPSYRDGVWLVELAGLADPALVTMAVASIVGMPEKTAGPAESDSTRRELLTTLIAHLRDKRLLLVLDNCEHLLAACADLAARLVAACPGVRLLATSREPLRLSAEVVWRVPPLACPDEGAADGVSVAELLRNEAVGLFVERARISRPGFTLSADNAAAVVRICRRLDGIPLAIELAAARLATLSAEGIAARLESSFRLLSTDDATALPRHQTLRAALDWSYALLGEVERAVFRRLSVFAGGWTLEAAQAVCAEPDADGAALNGDAALIDNYGAVPAMHEHPTVQIAEEAISVTPEEMLDVLVQLVARSFVQRDDAVLAGGEVRYRLLEPIRQYAAEALALSGETATLQRRHWAWCLALAERAEPELRGTAQDHWQALLDREQDNLRAALGWSMRQGGSAGEGLQLAAPLMWYWNTRGRLAEGRRWLEWALQVGSTAPADLRAGALNQAGILAWAQSDFAEAARLHRQSLEIKRALGDKRGIAGSLNNLALALADQGEYEEATRLHEESLALKRELGDQVWIASSLTNLGLLARWQGDYKRAMALYDEALAIRRAVSDTHGLITTLNNMGLVALKRGQGGPAQSYYAEALALSEELQYARGRADALAGLGLVAYHRHDVAQAGARLRQALALAQQMDDQERGAWYLEALADVLGGHGEARLAAQLLGAADAARAALRVRIPPADQVEHQRRVAAVRATLPEQAFSAAWATGSAMTLDAAITLANERAFAE